MVSYSVKNTFIDVTPKTTGRVRSSSAPPVANFMQVPAEPPVLVDLDVTAATTAANPDENVDDQLQRMSKATISQMQQFAAKLNLKSSRWIRVVHSGYGSATWEDALRRSDVTWVAASKKPEGVYVHVPTEMGKDGICQTLKQLNFAVRRDTYFRDMKRSNKSRLQFKEEIVVTASGTLIQEDASTSAGSEFGSPVEPSSDLDATEQFLSALSADFQAGPTVADAPTPHEMPGDSVLEYYQQPPQHQASPRKLRHDQPLMQAQSRCATNYAAYWRRETMTVPVYMCVGTLQ